MKKAIIIILIVVVVAVLGYFSLASKSSGMSVNVDLVESRDLTEKVSASGRIQPKTSVEITAETTAEIIDLRVNEGQQVEVGQLLVVLDTVQIASDVRQARYGLDEVKARLEGARASYEQNQEEYERQQRLFEKKLTSETDLKNARWAAQNSEASFMAAQASVKQTEALYEKQQDNLTKATIKAPMAGVITYLDAEIGEIAAAQTSFTQGKVLMIISDLSVFEVEVEVDETEINKIQLGQKADIEVDAIQDSIFEGRVVEIGNTATSSSASVDQSTNFLVKVTFVETGLPLRSGMSATVDITTSDRSDALAIPFASVVMRSYDMDSLMAARDKAANPPAETGGVQAAEDTPKKDSASEKDMKREDTKGVFVVRDSKAVFVPVETGIADQRWVEVTEGVTQSDTVISGPYNILRTIKDGETVEASFKKKGFGMGQNNAAN